MESWIADPFAIVDDVMPATTEPDAVIVMTPHTDTHISWPLNEFKKDCIVADIWKMYPESKLSNTGIYKVGDVK